MSDGLSIPLHLAVHIVGLAAVAGLFAHAARRRREIGPAWLGIALGTALLASQHVATGLVAVDGASWPVYARAAAYAGIAWGIAGQAAAAGAMPVVVVVAPTSVHVAAGIAGLLAGVTALRGVLERGGLLAAGIVGWATHDVLVRSRPELAAWIAVAGSVLVLAWVATASGSSVRARLLAATTALVAFAVVVVAAATGTLFTEQFREAAIENLRAPAAAIARDVQQDWPQQVEAQIRTTAGLVETIEIVRRANVDQRGAELIRRAGTIDLALVLSRDGVVRAASHRGGEAAATWSATLAGMPEVVAAGSSTEPQVGRTILRSEGLSRTSIAVFAAAPVLPRPSAGLDERIGILVIARLVDQADVQERASDAGADLVVVAGDEVIQSTRGLDDDGPLAAAVLAGQTQVDANDEELFVASVDGGRIGSVAIRAAAVDEVGVLTDPTGTTARDLFVRALLALLASALFAGALSRALARPVRRLTTAVERIGEGDFDTHLDVAERDDEFGRLATAFDDMAVALAARQEALQRAASTEAELRGRLQAITDSMSDGLLATDRDGRVISANPAATRLLGVPIDDLVGTTATDHLRGRTGVGEQLAEVLGRVGRDATAHRVQARLDATDLDVQVTTSPLRAADGSTRGVGAVLVLRDVSREAELARARRDFVTNISHELRTPLTLIMAPVRQLEKWRTRDDIAAIQSEILNRGTARMHRLERELTEWAQVELGRFASVTGVANLDEVLRRSVELVRWQFPDREVRVKVPARLRTIGMSNEALQPMVRELVHNAVLFSKHGGEPVDVRFKNVAGGVELSVRDRGIGMDQDTMRQAFEPYWQLDPSERRDFDGLGIGLTLAQRVAQMAGTTIELTSRKGRGTTATVLLPTAGD